MTPFTRWTPVAREKFLEKLKKTANVSLAADLIGVNRRRAYQEKKEDKEFAEAWEEALEIGTDNLEYKARQRAMDGVKRPVFYKGKKCGYITEYSDKLMDTLLAAHRPAKYHRGRNLLFTHNHNLICIHENLSPPANPALSSPRTKIDMCQRSFKNEPFSVVRIEPPRFTF